LAKIDNAYVKVDIMGRDCSSVEGKTTALLLAQKGVRAHDASMAQDFGVGACSAFTAGDDMSKG
jgi:hypothetical protein